jgi:hypothetical protein
MPIGRSHGFRLACLERLQHRPTTYVYAIGDGGGAVKIGKSVGHPRERLADLQTANPRPLTLLAWTQHLTERQAHRLFWRWHLRGEWFALDAGLVARLRLWDWIDEPALTKCLRPAVAVRYNGTSR